MTDKISPGEMDKTLVALKTIPMSLNWGKIFSLLDETRQHMVITLQCLELYADKVKHVREMSVGSIQYASCNMAVTFINDD